jgi:hypothetical protein
VKNNLIFLRYKIKQNSGYIKKLEDDRCKEPIRRHSLYTEVKRQDGMPSTLDEHIYDDLIDKGENNSA